LSCCAAKAQEINTRSLDSITFDTTGFTLQGDRNGVRVWHTPSGDGLGLYYYPVPPDIYVNAKSIDGIREFYRKAARVARSAIVEVERLPLDPCTVIRTIIKVPQQSSGTTYVGSLTMPFRDFSYVLKIQCPETGITGTRDSTVLNALLQTNNVSIGKNGQLQGWMEDPYDPSIAAPLARNKSEAEEYDLQFPSHPLTRLRRSLNHVHQTLKISDELKAEAPFEF
jgi:hypothetical protein